MEQIAFIRLLIGVILLFFGRRLFWFFVGAVGFLVGLVYAPQLFQGQPGWVLLLIALLAGVVGALLAVAVQRFAVALAGFFAAIYVVNSLLTAMGIVPGLLYWAVVILIGLIGAVLTSTFFDWALIILSALTGASLVTQALPVSSTLAALLFAGLLIAGIIVQAGLLYRQQAVVVPKNNE